MNKNTRRARAIAIAEAKPDRRQIAIRYFVTAMSASAAVIALLVARVL
jgi:hypothetical protein